MSHIVDRKTENYKKLFIVNFHQNLRKRSSLEMVRFFLRSVYITCPEHRESNGNRRVVQRGGGEGARGECTASSQ